MNKNQRTKKVLSDLRNENLIPYINHIGVFYHAKEKRVLCIHPEQIEKAVQSENVEKFCLSFANRNRIKIIIIKTRTIDFK